MFIKYYVDIFMDSWIKNSFLYFVVVYNIYIKDMVKTLHKLQIHIWNYHFFVNIILILARKINNLKISSK